ncbi:MAG: PhoU domain-containing protein [Candidatus Thorarchaeota archaeon]
MVENNVFSQKMETRKIQKTGGSSYVITLPKEWLTNLVKTKQLKFGEDEPNGDDIDRIKGMKLGLITQPDDTLLITPNLSGKPIERKKIINMEEIPDTTFFYRYLISAYIAGYTKVEISSKEALLPPFRLIIKDFVQQIIGCEVVEERDNYVLIKDLLKPEEMPFENIIKRMYRTTKNMHSTAIFALKNSEKITAQNVRLMDDDVDRLHWLVTRLTNILLSDPTLGEKMGITAGAAANMFLISRIIERIADHAVRIADNTVPLLDQTIDKNVIDQIEASIDSALQVFQISIDSLFERDTQKANQNIESIHKPEDISKMIMDYAFKQESFVAIPLDNIVESIRRIVEYSLDISENVINFLIRD